VLLPAFPDIRRGVTDAQVVTRRYFCRTHDAAVWSL
jgi:hypothetical protein